MNNRDEIDKIQNRRKNENIVRSLRVPRARGDVRGVCIAGGVLRVQVGPIRVAQEVAPQSSRAAQGR